MRVALDTQKEETYLSKRIHQWSKIDKTFKEGPINQQDVIELRDAFEKDLSFGTAGFRAKLAPGFNRMNMITGIAEYLCSLKRDKQLKVVLGYDHRHFSHEFAVIALRVLEAKGISVIFFNHIVPTPFVPFAVIRQGADFGLMITASHNSANYNGIKAYSSNGHQINCPVDRQIFKFIQKQYYNLWSLKESTREPLASKSENDSSLLYCEIKNLYIKCILERFLDFKRSFALNSIPIIFTAMHGVGWPIFHETIQKIDPDHKVVPLPSQCEPDPSFPTLKHPNPEEGISVFHQSIELANTIGANLIMAVDPDADRFNFVERACGIGEGVGEWRVFNGNEISALFSDFIWNNRSRLYPNFATVDHPFSFSMVTSIVSSKYLKSFCKKNQISYIETGTGFKNIANACKETTLFAYEEAIGFMVDPGNVGDKDGISAAILAYHMINEIYSKSMTISQYLLQLQEKYGKFIQYNSYWTKEDPIDLDQVFSGFSKCLSNLKTSMPSTLHSNEMLSIKRFSIDGDIVSIYFDDNELEWLILRPSGTENKIKFYSEVRECHQKYLKNTIDAICNSLLSPHSLQMPVNK